MGNHASLMGNTTDGQVARTAGVPRADRPLIANVQRLREIHDEAIRLSEEIDAHLTAQHTSRVPSPGSRADRRNE